MMGDVQPHILKLLLSPLSLPNITVDPERQEDQMGDSKYDNKWERIIHFRFKLEIENPYPDRGFDRRQWGGNPRN